MHPLLTLLIIGAVALIGYFFPKKYNESFYSQYHESIVSMPLAIVTAIFLALFLLLMDLGGFWFWSLLIASIVLSLIGILYVIYIGWKVNASPIAVIVAIVAQIFATAGVLILIIGVIAAIMQIFGGTKKKKYIFLLA